MFGYVIANIEDLTEEQKARYKSVYCGLCHTLKERFGKVERLALTYDLAFLVLLLQSLYEPAEQTGEERCIAHPRKVHAYAKSELTDYAADLNVYLAYYNCLDDLHDENSLKGRLGVKCFGKETDRIEKAYPRQTAAIRLELDAMEQLERAAADQAPSPDAMANHFGNLMAELFVWKEDRWEGPLRAMAAALGRFIYMADAYEDLEKDQKSGSYNPLLQMLKGEGAEAIGSFLAYEKPARSLLTALIAESTAAFETLPLEQDLAVLRNILYSGVWTRFNAVTEKRRKSVPTANGEAHS